MKKILFSLVCMVAALQLSAQQPNISNPGFEQWTSGHPTGWTTSISGSVNVNLGFMTLPIPVSLNFGSQTTDAHSGDYALKLTANGMDLSNYGLPQFSWPGMAQLGTAGQFSVSLETIQQLVGLNPMDIDMSDIQNLNWDELASLRNVLSTGDAFTMVPSAMKVYVKYLPPVGVTDTMLILVGAYDEGAANMLIVGETPAAYGYLAVTDRIENYTELTVPIEFDPDDVSCDSLLIMFFSSSFLNANQQTELYIDDISFEYDYLSVESSERIKMNLYPNPATEYMMVNPADQSEVYDIMVYDINGKQIKSMERLTGNIRVDLKELASGTYFLKMMQSGNELVRKFVVE